MRAVCLGLLAGSLLLGCASDDGGPPDKIRDDIPDPLPGGVQLISPTFTIPAGTEVFMCMRIPFEVTDEMYVHGSIAYQIEGGHHSMLYYSDEPQGGDEPHECGAADMGNIRFIGVGTSDGVGISLPDGVALKIPEGAKIYTQAHYLNVGTSDILAQDVINLDLRALSEVEHVAGAFTEVDLTLDLAAEEVTTRVIDCDAPMAMNVPWLIPHMHELGTHYTVEVIDGDTEEVTTVYDQEWDPTFRDHFPVVPFEEPLVLDANDRMRTTCTWDNTTTTRRLFPNEMCATFMPFYPSPDGALLACDETGTHFRP